MKNDVGVIILLQRNLNLFFKKIDNNSIENLIIDILSKCIIEEIKFKVN
jgi:hypothetical protein